MSIRTPDQRLRIFVSSTLEELAEERGAVREAIEGLHLTPVMFELGARPHPPRILYHAYLDQSDVFVGVYWQRYGWLAPGEEVSGLEDEYRSAGDRPRLIYLKEPAPGRERRLESLLREIKADREVSYRRFTDPLELRGLVADDLAVLVSERFGVTAAKRSMTALRPPQEQPLPVPLTRLIGRESEVERLVALLGDPSNRLVTIVGPGGIGKTRFALAVAERVRTRYPDGVFYVPLAALAEVRLVIPAIARALGIGESDAQGVASGLRRALASAQCLIVLDNLEQVADAAADLVDLIAATSNLQILATSRSVLDVSGEHVFELGPLAVPREDGDRTPAVDLFLERMASIRPDFATSADDRAAIAEVVRRLDGLPLAIELAAAQTRVLSPRQLLERMGYRRLRILESDRRDLPARQQTLRETIDWSYELLGQSERLLFEHLAVVVGSASLPSIEAITNVDGNADTVQVLGSLVEASLVRTTSEAGEVRFGMLETTREYANERLEASGQAEVYRNRHADHYIALATAAAAGLRSSAQLDWLARYDRENDNFRAVLRRAIRRDDAASAARMGLLLLWYWQMRNEYTEGRSWMQAVRRITGASAYARAAAWTVEAMLAVFQGEVEFIEAGIDEATDVLRAQDDAHTLGLALLLKAAVGGLDAGGPAVQDAATEASGLLDVPGDAFLEAIALLGRSYVAERTGRTDDAIALAARALELSHSIGDTYIRSIASGLLATYALARGNFPEVRALAREALLAARELRNLSTVALPLELWAAAELDDGHVDLAGHIYALADRAYGLSRALPWRPPSLRESIAGLHAALGPRLEQLVLDARALDLDAAIVELTGSPSA